MMWSNRSASAPAAFNGLLRFPQYSRAFASSPMPVPPKGTRPDSLRIKADPKALANPE
jgi:hypothetical protein